jgi:hypothetical protein
MKTLNNELLADAVIYAEDQRNNELTACEYLLSWNKNVKKGEYASGVFTYDGGINSFFGRMSWSNFLKYKKSLRSGVIPKIIDTVDNGIRQYVITQ